MFIEGDSVVGIDAKELFDFFDDLLDVDPGLDDPIWLKKSATSTTWITRMRWKPSRSTTSISKKSRTSMTTRKTKKRISDGDLCLWIESRRQARRWRGSWRQEALRRYLRPR